MPKEIGRNGLCRDLAVVILLAASGCTGVTSAPPTGGGTTPSVPGNSGMMVGTGSTNTPAAGPTGVTGAGATTPVTPTGAGGSAAVAGVVNGKVHSVWEDAVSTTTLDPGRVVLRRLNNPEYDNTVRDLLGTMDKASQKYMFPADDINELFDTNGQTLVYSDLLFSQVQTAAQGLVTDFLARMPTDPIRMRIMTCTPTVATMSTCLTGILKPFMAQAYRRPVTDAEVTQVVTVATTIATAHNDPTPGVSAALQAVLMSPNFLFRLETSANPTSSAATKINDYELATRLSYFIGSTMPDATLTAAAAAGKLAPAGADFTSQVDRLIADPVRLSAFVTNFAGRWLGLPDTVMVAPDDTLFGTTFSDAVRLAMPQETSQFFQSLITDKQPISALLTANYTFVNDSLAKIYGLTAPSGTTLGKVMLPPTSNRMGLLTQETFLTITSQPDRTSPVKRGVWILENLLCDGTPAPPANIAALPAQGTGTVRQVLAIHRANPFCASCHSVIDPYGLAFENYDAIGQYRTKDNGMPVDSSATMADGSMVTGAMDLATQLSKDSRTSWCFTKQALTYGVGRSFEATTGRAYVKGLADPLIKANATWPDLVKAIATSEAFRTSRGEGP